MDKLHNFIDSDYVTLNTDNKMSQIINNICTTIISFENSTWKLAVFTLPFSHCH